jgi:hypothetical protein
MADIVWTTLAQKVNAELNKTNYDIMTKSFTTAQGVSKENRSFQDIAFLQTVAKNQEAMENAENNGFVILAEMDWNQ